MHNEDTGIPCSTRDEFSPSSVSTVNLMNPDTPANMTVVPVEAECDRDRPDIRAKVSPATTGLSSPKSSGLDFEHTSLCSMPYTRRRRGSEVSLTYETTFDELPASYVRNGDCLQSQMAIGSLVPEHPTEPALGKGAHPKRLNTRDPIIEGEETVWKPTKKRDPATYKDQHDIDTVVSRDSELRIPRLAPKAPCDFSRAGRTSIQEEHKTSSRRQLSGPADNVYSDGMNRVQIHPSSPILRSAPQYDPILQPDGSAWRSSVKLYEHSVQDESVTCDEKQTSQSHRRCRSAMAADFADQRTSRIFDETAQAQEIGCHSKAVNLLYGSLRPTESADVLSYRFSGGICPDSLDLQDKRPEKAAYETELKALLKGSEETRALYDSVCKQSKLCTIPL